MNGARGVIINVTGGPDMSLMEVNEALTIIQEAAHEDANIIFGAVVDPTLTGKVKITVIATGFDHVRTDRSTPADGADADAGGPDGLHVAGPRRASPPAVRAGAAAAADASTRRPPLELPSRRGRRRPRAGRLQDRRGGHAGSTCQRSCAERRASSTSNLGPRRAGASCRRSEG